jgi:osmotically-inducible protein OsmY
MSRADARLRDGVRDQLAEAPELDASMIAVSVKDGVITLSGYVSTYAASLAAVRAAKRVQGARAVANELEIRLAEDRIDPDLAKDAMDALRRHVQVPSTVQVTVRNGWISLTGDVEWMYQRAAAEHAVKYLRGVQGVHNYIVVRPKVSPGDVQGRIKAALERSALVEAAGIHVTVNGPEVTLTGTVRSFAERDEAERAAWTVPGVAAVEDRILVAP